MNEYVKQANDFCTKDNVIIDVDFLCKDYHFEDDKQKRDIYNITIKRGLKRFSFKEYIKYVKIKCAFISISGISMCHK